MDIETLKIFAAGVSNFSSCLYGKNNQAEITMAFRDALSAGQLNSKIHILEALQINKMKLNKALFIGQWHGLLPFLLINIGLCESGVGFELNPFWKTVSDRVCQGLAWTSTEGDATEISSKFYEAEKFDSVINTSCEHMNFNWIKALPQNIWVIAQATDYKIPEHTHPQASLDEFESNLGLSSILHKSELDFKIYKRFTIIGRK